MLQFQAGFKTSSLSDGHVLKQGGKLMHSTFQLLSLTISSMLRQHVNTTLLPDLISAAAPIKYLLTYRLSQTNFFFFFAQSGLQDGLIKAIKFAAPYRRRLVRHTIEGGREA